jgi:hypothetical protein
LKRGDFITKVGERPIDTPAQFHAALGDWPGTVPLTLQDGREAMIAEPK